MPEIYRIRVKGHLAAHWADWFSGMTITHLDRGETLIEGPIVDQAALHGMLNHIRDLGLPLLSVDRIVSGENVNGETGETLVDDERTGE
ncbi:MAG TPA: hypothetical protein VMP08_05500 [Anaerolineae bacterium]|nr:hypothetical protein [Anaerolineae bacterium]